MDMDITTPIGRTLADTATPALADGSGLVALTSAGFARAA
jgi:hypothetical protein